MTQAQKVIQFIEQNGSITTMDAYGMGITRLASRIHEIQGFYPLNRTMETALNRDGEKVHFMRYSKAV